MGYSVSVHMAAKNKLLERRLKAQKDADIRQKTIYRTLSEARQLNKEINNLAIELARGTVKNYDDKQKNELSKKFSLKLNEFFDLLKSYGYDENVFEPDYFCKKCNDTGYYEDNGKTVVCSCLKQELIKCACDELNITAPLSLSTFDTFSLEYYDRSRDSETNISPNAHMGKVLNYCKNYAENFSQNSNSIFMKGKTGLGKTHLSLAHRLEKDFFSKSDDDPINDMLLECDLLIVDDLGTEFHTQFSVSEIYNILNSRILVGKPFIINTNLNLRELEKIYSERFVSRIMGNAQKLDFFGNDIRVRKGQRKNV